MRIKHRLIERYVAAAILPYFWLTLTLLTTVLLLQQANRFAETLGSGAFSFWSSLEVTAGILPGVLIFTVPMSALMGVAIGISRMASDSELIACQSSGVGRGRFLLTVSVFGGLLTVLSLILGLELSPRSLRLIKSAALQAIAHKLESPVDLREFNLSLPGKVIYVRDGDKEGGEWRRIFINWQEPGKGGTLRLITARSGRIDSSTTGQSELVLRDAVVTTISEQSASSNQEIISEHAQTLRIKDGQLNTNRNAAIDRIENKQLEVDEMRWGELVHRAAADDNPKEKIKASLALHRRLALGISPLIFAVLGALIGLRNRRGGRALGMLISMGAMLAYYLVALAGEQLARIELLSPAIGPWVGTSAAIMAILLLLTPLRVRSPLVRRSKVSHDLNLYKLDVPFLPDRNQGAPPLNVFGGLIDRTILRQLLKSFVLALLTLLAVFYIFTLFELLRFIDPGRKNLAIFAEYLVYLMPFAFLALVPMSVLVAVLITYALTARASEAVAWWASGQSSYRLAAPGIFFATLIGAGVWLTQEKVMPQANVRQETLRARIRGGMTKNISPTGRYWLAAPFSSRIYSYDYGKAETHLQNPAVYDFDQEGVHLIRILMGTEGKWDAQDDLQIINPVVFDLKANTQLLATGQEVIKDSLSFQQFKPLFNRPSQISSSELSDYIRNLRAREDNSGVNALETALQRKWSEPFVPVVMSLIAIPLGIGFGKRSAVSALASSVIIGVSLWGINSSFFQLGTNGIIPPLIAGWAPTLVYATAGIYLLFHART